MAPPGPVQNFVVLSITYTSITVGWSAYTPQSSINRFYIYVGLNPADRSNRDSINKTTTSKLIARYPFTIGPQLTPGTKYYITIVANSNANGNSSEVQLEVNAMALTAPTGFILSNKTSNSLNYIWSQYPDYANIDNLKFYLDTQNPPVLFTLKIRSSTSHNTTGLLSNTVYYTALSAIVNGNEGPTTDDYQYTDVAPITGLTLGSTPTEINANWTNPTPSASIINAFITTNPSDYGAAIPLQNFISSFGFSGLTPGQTYYIKIQNVGGNDSKTDTTSSIATLPTPPLLSINFTEITTSGFHANLTYDIPTPDEIGYRIGTTNPPIDDYTILPLASQIVWGDKTEDTNYFLQVKARISGVDSVPIIQAVYTINGIPTNFTVKGIPTTSTIIMGWDASPSPTTGYLIWISTVVDVFDGDSITLGVVQEYEFTGLAAETTYYFKLVDIGSGSPSEPTYSVGLTAPAPVENTNNFILYVYKATNGFKHSPHSLKRSSGGPVFRQIRGGW